MTAPVPDTMTCGEAFDLIQGFGGEIERVAKNISLAAICYPATRSWIIEDLKRLDELCKLGRKTFGRRKEKSDATH